MSPVMKSVRTLLIAAALSSACLADEVVLRNGSVFTGIVREDGDRVVIEVDFGTLSFKKVDVRSISRGGEDPIREFQEKSKTATDAKSMVALAAWAKEKGLGTRANDLYRKVIALDPDQADARKALGYEKFDGLWLSGDDLMVAKGFLKLNGRWVPKDTAERAQELDALRSIENDRIIADIRAADQRHSAALARIALERERLEVEKSREDRYWSWRTPWAWGANPFNGVVGYVLPPQQPAGAQRLPPTPPTVLPLGSPSPLPPTKPK